MSVRKTATDSKTAQTSGGGKAVSPALARAVSLHLEGKHKDALKELNTALENGEESPEIYSAKGHLQFELEQFDDSVRSYEKLLTLAPRHSTANFNLGICYEKLGRWNEAAEAFQKALDTDPSRLEAQLGLGICLLHQEKPEPAITCFEKVLARTPAHETALFGKAVSLQLLWKFDESTALYLQLLNKNPQSEECLVNLVTIGMARKDEAMTREYSEKLLTIRPSSLNGSVANAKNLRSFPRFERSSYILAKIR